MKACVKNLFLLPVLIAGMELLLAGRATAQPAGYLWLFSNVNSTEDTFEQINPSTGALVQTITHYSVGAALSQGGDFGVESQWSITLASSPVLLELPGDFSLDGLRGLERRQRSL
jgi:hypothetical protein